MMRTIIKFALHLLASLLPSSGFTVQPATRLLLNVAKTKTALSVSTSPITGVGSSKVDGWSDLNIRPATPVDVNVMEVVGSDYSHNCPIDTVVRCEKPGVQYDGTLTQRAQVIVSLGPEPPELAGTSGGFGQTTEDTEFELAENEYIVRGGTKIDRTRMYVLTFEKSPREGGTVIRSLKPGLLSPDGSTINLAEVIASSGPNGDWKEDRNAEKTLGGEEGGSAGGDWSSGRNSEGMVAFSSGRLGPPGGTGRQSGYIYGPTKKKSDSSLSQSSQAEGKSGMWSMPGNEQLSYGNKQPSYSQPAHSQRSYSQPAHSQRSYSQPAHSQSSYSQSAHSQPAYSQPAYSRYSNNTYEGPPKSQHGVASSTYNQQQYPHEQPYGRPFGEKGAFTGYSNPSQSDTYKQQAPYSQRSTSQYIDKTQALRDKFEQLGEMLNDMQSQNDPYGQQQAYGQAPKMDTIASGLDEIATSLEQIRSRPTPPGEIERLQNQIERLDSMVQSNSRGSEQLKQQLSDLTAKSQKWDRSLEKLRNFLSRREGRVSNFRQHLDQVMADYIASENEIMNLVEDSYTTSGSTTSKDSYDGNTYTASPGYGVDAASATDTTGTSSYWTPTSDIPAKQNAGGNSFAPSSNYGVNSTTQEANYGSTFSSSTTNPYGVNSTTQEANYGSAYSSSTTNDAFGASSAYTSSTTNDAFGASSAYTSSTTNDAFGASSAYTSSTTNDTVGAIPHWASTWGEKTYQQLEQQQLELDKEQQSDDKYSSSSAENNYEEVKQKDQWDQTRQNPIQNQGKEEGKHEEAQGTSQKAQTKPSYSPFGASHTTQTKPSFSPFGSGNSNWVSQTASSSEKPEAKKEEKWVPRWQRTQQNDSDSEQDPAEDEVKKTKSVFSLFRSNIKKNSTITDAKKFTEIQSTKAAAPPAATVPAFSGFGHATAPLGPDNSPFEAKPIEEPQVTEEMQQTATASAPPAATAAGSSLNTKPTGENQDIGGIQQTVAVAAPPAAAASDSPSTTKPIEDNQGVEETKKTSAATAPPAATVTKSSLKTKPMEETQGVKGNGQNAAAKTPPRATTGTTSYLDGL